MDYEQLLKEARAFLKKHPQFKDEVYDLVGLADAEISSGESEEHECDMAWNDIEQLLIEE